MEKIKWAVNATGYISREFAKGMQHVSDAEIVAVSSTNIINARNYAREFGIDESGCYDDYEKMLSDKTADAVYVCTPNHLHYEQCLLGIKHGFHVLSEKPCTDNVQQLQNLIEAANDAGLFFTEGMWTRFFPVVKKVRAWLDEGKIGRPRTFFGSFGADQRESESQWRYDSGASGGALRDVGIYPIAFAFLVFGKPDSWTGGCKFNNAGIDVFNNIMLRYGEDSAAFISSAIDSGSTYDLQIIGTEGHIIVGPDFWRPQIAKLYKYDGTCFGIECAEVFEEKYSGNGFEYEIMAVGDCIRNNELEADDYTHQETLDITELMQDMRKEWGIEYPSDR